MLIFSAYNWDKWLLELINSHEFLSIVLCCHCMVVDIFPSVSTHLKRDNANLRFCEVTNVWQLVCLFCLISKTFLTIVCKHQFTEQSLLESKNLKALGKGDQFNKWVCFFYFYFFYSFLCCFEKNWWCELDWLDIYVALSPLLTVITFDWTFDPFAPGIKVRFRWSDHDRIAFDLIEYTQDTLWSYHWNHILNMVRDSYNYSMQDK